MAYGVNLVPWQVWAAGGVALALFGSYKLGQHDRQQDWDESREKGEQIVERLVENAGKVTVKIQERVVFRDRIIEVQGKAREVIRTKFVPVDSGYLTGGFRLYHDAAATATVPDEAGIPYAAPTAVADVAATIDTNYQLAHKCYARLEEWNNWANEQEALQAAAIEEAKNGR